jgi:hypothetical protein
MYGMPILYSLWDSLARKEEIWKQDLNVLSISDDM